ncbi:hypothetical protein LCGC14_2740880 [marine sediment metagenome]|uniref:Uncharacterized protein n=1 Tax=marine sediment metagenome TaxID=412755 RepID=A0A0F8Z4E8_9ZZZZ
MAKYRARFDGEAYNGPMWLTDDNQISSVGAATVRSLNEIVNLLAKMARTNPDTVRNGAWTLERRQMKWQDVG